MGSVAVVQKSAGGCDSVNLLFSPAGCASDDSYHVLFFPLNNHSPSWLRQSSHTHTRLYLYPPLRQTSSKRISLNKIPLQRQASSGAWFAPEDVRQQMIDLIQVARVRGRQPRVSIASSRCLIWICSSSCIFLSSLSRCSLSCFIWLVRDVADMGR